MSVAVPSRGSEREVGAACRDAHLTARHRVGNARSRQRKFSFAPQHAPAPFVAQVSG
jgi:hypothetical protein